MFKQGVLLEHTDNVISEKQVWKVWFTSRRAVDMFKQGVLLEHTDNVISEKQVWEVCKT
jgi:hypothetical protein